MRTLSGFYLPTWDATLGIDSPPLSPSSMDDEFDDDSFDTSKWSWLDQGSTTASESEGRLTLTLPDDSNRMRGIYQSAPSTPWMFQAKMNVPLGDPGRVGQYLFCGQSATEEIQCVGYYQNTADAVHHFFLTPSSTVSASGSSLPVYQSSIWLMLAFDGTNILFAASWDGEGFYTLDVDTPGYTPGIVGLAILNENAPTVPFSFEWFRQVF